MVFAELQPRTAPIAVEGLEADEYGSAYLVVHRFRDADDLTPVVSGNPVALLSGEGGGLGRRVKAWMQTFGGGQDLRALPVLALERPLNLNREEEMAMLVEAMDKAQIRPTLVVIDTLSKFSAGMDENSNQEVAAYLSAVSRFIRERYDASVLIVAHSGHGDADRPRGASALMANPDSEFIVKRAAQPNTHVEVTRQRFKDTGELPNLAYEAEVVDLRCVRPLDAETILGSLSRTGRIIIASEGWPFGGPGAEVAALVAERGFPYLDAPPVRLAAQDTPIPFPPELFAAHHPDDQVIVQAALDLAKF
jgi:hypothetical protein